MGLFSRRKAAAAAAPVAIVHLNARVQPMHRGSVYEDPLDQLLAQHAPGSRVVGGGTEFSPETGPLSADTEIELAGDAAASLARAVDILEHLGAPIGSWAQLGDGPQVPFGRTHGLALILDIEGLPAEVYEQHDVNELIGTLLAVLDGSAELQSWWEGETTTSLYFYGEDAPLIRAVLEQAAERHPLARGSRVEAIT